MRKTRSKVVVIGGGTGTFANLLALRDFDIDVTALLTMVDDGGSNRILRDQFGLLPTSGICQAIVALSEDQTVLRELFNYRYHQGKGIDGMRFGNLFLAAVTDIVGSQKKAIEETQKILKVRGSILPISYDDVRLVSTLENGQVIHGQHRIDEPMHDGKLHIKKLATEPAATISQEARQAILTADHIIFGPGDLYGNTIANLIIEGVPEALCETKAQIIFVSNLMTKYGETYNFTLNDFLHELDRYLGMSHIDCVLVNSNTDYPQEALDLYKKESSIPVLDDMATELQNTKIVRADLVSSEVYWQDESDVIKRSLLRHDSKKMKKMYQKLFGLKKSEK